MAFTENLGTTEKARSREAAGRGRKVNGKMTSRPVDDRLLKRRLVEKWLETCRRGEIDPKYLGRAVKRIYEEAGRVFLEILLRDLEAAHIRDRHLAAGCLLELPVSEEVKAALRRTVRDRRRHLWARGICLIALSGMNENIDGLMQRYPELSHELPVVMARQYIEALSDEDLSNGHGWEDFLRNPEEAQVEVINLLMSAADARVVDFLVWAAQRTPPAVREVAREALGRLRLAGVDVDRGRREGAGESSPLLAVREGHAAMKQWNFARAVFYLSGALERLPRAAEASLPVRLQLVTALLRDGQTREALRQAEELVVAAGPEHFYGQKAGQLARAIAEVLLPEKEGTGGGPVLDPVEAAINELLVRCAVPRRYFHRALVVWDNYLRYTPEPIRQIDDARVWAAAVIWATSWIGRGRPRREDIRRATTGLPAREVKRRAYLIWNALGLAEDRRWLEREMACVEAADEAEDEVSQAVKDFLQELSWQRSASTVRRYQEGLVLLWQYLVQRADVCSPEEITPEHLVEFLACWYIGTEGIKRSVPRAKALIGTVWSFCQWLDIRKGTHLIQPYLPLHRQLRREVPRALTLAGLLPGSSFAGPQRFERQVSDYFRVENLARQTMEMHGLRSGLQLRGVVIPPEGKDLVRPADILYLTLGKRKHRWYIIDSGAVFPALAAPFVGQD